jgi:hypothetical protein
MLTKDVSSSLSCFYRYGNIVLYVGAITFGGTVSAFVSEPLNYDSKVNMKNVSRANRVLCVPVRVVMSKDIPWECSN